MIVLDEQLLGRGLDREISHWYRGSVRFIVDLRPGTVIKDDAIPGLLRQQASPTFVTINVRDFWRKVDADERYCVVCAGFSDSRVKEIPELLKSLFSRAVFSTKRVRMGKVVRMMPGSCSFYSSDKGEVRPL